jgi:hypothetical protein
MTVRTLAQIAAFLQATPSSYDMLTASQKTDLRDTLAPKIAGFDGQQRAWFRDWWFECTQAQVNAANALLPTRVRLSPVAYNSKLWLNIDIATDCITAGETYYPARSVLRTLVMTNVPNLPDLLPQGGA